MQPLSNDERSKLKASGDLTQRIAFSQKIGNHQVKSSRHFQVLLQAGRSYLQGKGMSKKSVDRLTVHHLTRPVLAAPPPAWRGMPTTGMVKIFALLIEFKDILHVNEANMINDALFSSLPESIPCESLVNYYKRSSYGKLDLSGGTTLGWYKTDKKRSEIIQDTNGRESLIKEALNHFNAIGHDFKQYDNDNDGIIDYFMVFWTGPDNGWSNFWWGYQTDFTDPNFTLGGVKLGKYSWQWESNPVGSVFNPVVVIHETGHALGLPDLYDYDDVKGPAGGVGGADMMDANKFDHNCFSKWMLEWLTPTIIGNGTHNVTLNPSGTSPDCVAIWPYLNNGDVFSEFFMVQNRQGVGNDSNFPEKGLLIWHIDASLNAAGDDFAFDNSFTSHKLVRMMEADGKEDIEANRGFDPRDCYTPGKSFTPNSKPASIRYDGKNSFVEVSNIKISGSQISATFKVRDLKPVS